MMNDHGKIDRRGLALAQAIVAKLERDGVEAGVERARSVNRRWREMNSSSLHEDWADLLEQEWNLIKEKLLSETDRGDALRQNNPFCGILTHQERWKIIKEFDRYAS
jgi:ketopantoate reductase